jgi:hypothetical protein
MAQLQQQEAEERARKVSLSSLSDVSVGGTWCWIPSWIIVHTFGNELRIVISNYYFIVEHLHDWYEDGRSYGWNSTQSVESQHDNELPLSKQYEKICKLADLNFTYHMHDLNPLWLFCWESLPYTDNKRMELKAQKSGSRGKHYIKQKTQVWSS